MGTRGAGIQVNHWYRPHAFPSRVPHLFITLGCIAALSVAFLLEVMSHSTMASLSLTAILLAVWWLPRRLALTVVVVGLLLRLLALGFQDAGPLTVAAQLTTLLTGFFLAALVAARLAAARKRNALLPLSRAARLEYRLTRLFAWRRGNLRAARQMAPAVEALFQQAGDLERAQLVTNDLGWIAGLGGDLKGQEETARRLLESPGVGGPRVILPASLSIGMSLLQQGRFDGALPAFRRSRELAGRPIEVVATTSALALSLALEGRLREAKHLLDEADANGVPTGSSAGRARVALLWLAGEYERAIAAKWEFRPGAPDPRRDWLLPYLAISAAECGRLEIARRWLLLRRPAYEDGQFPVLRDLLFWADGVVAWCSGRLEDAVGQLRYSAADLLRLGALPMAAFVLYDLAEVAARAGLVAETRRATVKLGQLAERLDRMLYAALADIAWARVCLGTEKDPDARELARRAVAVLQSIGCQAYAARGLDVLGGHLSLYSRAEGVDALAAASALHTRSGAAWRQHRSADALRRLGHAGRRAAAERGGPSTLTKRELEVTRLATQGLTAPQIAKKLFITERTVETHLANSYAKLGIRSRHDLASRAAEVSELSIRYGSSA